MWPFKKKEPVVAAPAPCGDDKVHAYWKGKGWVCPRTITSPASTYRFKVRSHE